MWNTMSFLTFVLSSNHQCSLSALKKIISYWLNKLMDSSVCKARSAKYKLQKNEKILKENKYRKKTNIYTEKSPSPTPLHPLLPHLNTSLKWCPVTNSFLFFVLSFNKTGTQLFSIQWFNQKYLSLYTLIHLCQIGEVIVSSGRVRVWGEGEGHNSINNTQNYDTLESMSNLYYEKSCEVIVHWCLRHFWNWPNYSVNLISTELRYFYWW